MLKTFCRLSLAVAIVTAAGLQTGAQGQSQTVSMPGYPAVGAPPTVTLLSPGAEPRTPLRVKVPVGHKEAMLMTMSVSALASMEGNAMPQMDLPTMKMGANLAVTGVSPAGDITYELAFTEMSVEALPGTDPSLATMMQGAAGSITSLKGTVTITNRGLNKSATLNLDQISDPSLKMAMQSFSGSLESLSTPVPEEAVGPGAKWEVRQATKSGGANMFQKVTCELVSVTATVATLKVTIEQAAPAQSISNPMLQGMTMDVERLVGSGTGSIQLPLNGLVPTSQATTSTTIAMSMNGQKMTVETKLKMNVAPKT
jgi:hypothetical protein